jgi:gluconokinase
MVIVVMGVSGAGKTTVGKQLASQLGWPFYDADDLHSPANIARMRGGEPLTDEHRTPWLEALARLVGEHAQKNRSMVLACSALRRSHRTALLAQTPGDGDVRLVHLHTDADQLAQRLELRAGHFFPLELLDTQLAELEPPQSDETTPVLVLDAMRGVDDLVATIREELNV